MDAFGKWFFPLFIRCAELSLKSGIEFAVDIQITVFVRRTRQKFLLPVARLYVFDVNSVISYIKKYSPGTEVEPAIFSVTADFQPLTRSIQPPCGKLHP